MTNFDISSRSKITVILLSLFILIAFYNKFFYHTGSNIIQYQISNNQKYSQNKIEIKNRVGFFLIGTGKYIRLTSQLMNSMEMYFCTKKRTYDVYVHYFILTDNLTFKPNISVQNSNRNFSIFYQKKLAWPESTLLRFENILQNEEKINFKSFDYLYWLDSDAKMVDYVCEDIFGDLVGTMHPHYYKSSDPYPYESNNPKSTAFLEQHHKYENPYYVGAFYGGSGIEMYKLFKTCHENIQYDFNKLNGFIAFVHDESHLNR